MGNNGMNPKATGQTNPGGECMDYQEITLGQVTYEIRRVYTGERLRQLRKNLLLTLTPTLRYNMPVG